MLRTVKVKSTKVIHCSGNVEKMPNRVQPRRSPREGSPWRICPETKAFHLSLERSRIGRKTVWHLVAIDNPLEPQQLVQ